MAPSFEQVLSQARALPLADRLRLWELLAQEAAQDVPEARHELVLQTMGSMAGLLPSTEKFLAEKHAELAAEEGEPH